MESTQPTKIVNDVHHHCVSLLTNKLFSSSDGSALFLLWISDSGSSLSLLTNCGLDSWTDVSSNVTRVQQSLAQGFQPLTYSSRLHWLSKALSPLHSRAVVVTSCLTNDTIGTHLQHNVLSQETWDAALKSRAYNTVLHARGLIVPSTTNGQTLKLPTNVDCEGLRKKWRDSFVVVDAGSHADDEPELMRLLKYEDRSQWGIWITTDHLSDAADRRLREKWFYAISPCELDNIVTEVLSDLQRIVSLPSHMATQETRPSVDELIERRSYEAINVNGSTSIRDLRYFTDVKCVLVKWKTSTDFYAYCISRDELFELYHKFNRSWGKVMDYMKKQKDSSGYRHLHGKRTQDSL